VVVLDDGGRWWVRRDNGGKSGGRSSAVFCLQRSEGSEVRRGVRWADANGARAAVDMLNRG
jgi:hypothetical protein